MGCYRRLHLTVPVLYTRSECTYWDMHIAWIPKDFPNGTRARVVLGKLISRPPSFFGASLKLIWLKMLFHIIMIHDPLPFYNHLPIFTKEGHTSHHPVFYQGALNLGGYLENKRGNLNCTDVNTSVFLTGQHILSQVNSNPLLSIQLKDLIERSLKTLFFF